MIPFLITALDDNKSAEQLHISKKEVVDFRVAKNLTWHECNDMKTMQLVPEKINSFFGHTGGVGEINLLFDLLEGNLK